MSAPQIPGYETYMDPSGQAWPYPSAPAPAIADPMSGAPAGTGPAPAPFVPVPAVNPAANPAQQPAGPATYPADMGESIPDIFGAADRQAAAGGPPGAPDLTPGASNQPALIPSTTTTESTTTTGIDAKGEAGVRAAGDAANSAAQAAGDAKAQEQKDLGAFEMSQGQQQYGRSVNDYFQRAAEIQLQDDIITDVAGKLEDAAKFKPDRTALFKGDNGVLFGISAAISAMAGGWLMGQGLTGGKNPYLDSVMRMIDDNARDQVETNSLVYQELTKRLGSAEAAKRELKSRMLEAVNGTIEAQARFEKGELVQKGAAGIQAQVLGEIAKNRLDVEKAVAKNVTKARQTNTQMVANPALTGGLDVTDAKVAARMDKVGELEGVFTEAASLAGTGDLKGSVGFVDEGIDAVKGWFNSKSVPEQRVQDLKARWETAQRSNWSSEPNGIETQKRLSLIAFPQNDAGIPHFLRRVREVMNVVDPGGRYRMARRAMGARTDAVETGRTPIVR